MRYISTRGNAPVLGFEDVMLTGLARDGGLYVPESWPRLSRRAIAALAGKPFAEIAAAVVAPFTAGGDTDASLALTAAVMAATGVAIPFSEHREDNAWLREITREAYASFGHPAVTPLVQIGPNRCVLELFHGPTLAFKDVAMQLLARLMDRALTRRNARAMIVGATSGDTGGAAVEAFAGSRRVDVVILFPKGRVSDVQRRMMTTPTAANIHAVEIEGTFDDCQALVKALFNDHAFRDRVSLAGINSINWARIAAQVPYYFAAATALGAPGRAVSFVVPTGNFGDVLAGFVAKRMGLPIDRLVIASNSNDILPRALADGRYETRGVAATTSPSMDIQVSSNFERVLFEAFGHDPARVRDAMGALAQGGGFPIGASALAALRADFDAAAATEPEVADAIRNAAAFGYGLDPHTACAVVAADKTLGTRHASPQVILATAHPAKFPDAIAAITGVRPPLPARLAGLMTAPERITPLPNDAAAVKAFVAGRAHG